MNKITCPFCEEILVEGTVTIGLNSDPVFSRRTQDPLYFNVKGENPKRLLGFFDEKPALHCLSCNITIINKAYSEVPIGLGGKAYTKNQLIRLKNLMGIFYHPNDFEEYLKYHDRTKFYQEHLKMWEEILSEETAYLLQLHYTLEYEHVKAFYNILKSANHADFEKTNFCNTETWKILHESSLKSREF